MYDTTNSEALTAPAAPATPAAPTFVFESMNLQVGSRLQLLSHRQMKPQQYFSTLIGYVKDEYILVKIPFENGFPVTMQDGEKVTIRVFSGTKVCFFTCTVLRVLLQPFFYVHLSFPQQIQGTSLRMATRVKVDIPGRITKARSANGTPALPVTLTNLSVAGALIQSTRELPYAEKELPGLSFTLITQPGDHAVTISTKVAIRNAKAQKAQGPDQEDVFIYGLQFVELDPTHQIVLQNLTYEALIGDRQNIV